MLSFRIQPEWIGNPEIPFESRICPNCAALNWAAGRYMCEIGVSETEAIQCWHCDTVFWIDGYSSECVDEPSNAIICVGSPDPAIPLQVLRDLVDASQQCWGDMRTVDEKRPELRDDPTLVEVRENLKQSINYVIDLIHDLEVV